MISGVKRCLLTNLSSIKAKDILSNELTVCEDKWTTASGTYSLQVWELIFILETAGIQFKHITYHKYKNIGYIAKIIYIYILIFIHFNYL